MYTSINKKEVENGATDTTQKLQILTDWRFITCFL